MMAEKIRILYVDDEQNLLELCKVFLERSGNFIVTTSTGAPEALRILELSKVDAIISDYQMPEMDGIEFLKAVRARGNKTPFIIFTGKGREEVVIEALNAGADFYIQKGGEPKAQFAELAHKIKRAVEHQVDEKSLKKSQVQLEEAMDLAHMVNWEFDVASGIFTFNDRFYALYGTTAEREGGYQMPAEVYAREFVHPEEGDLVAQEVQNAITATDPNYTRQIEHRIIRRDGEVQHIIVRFGITKDAHGRTVKTHGANQDITDRIEAEKSIRMSREFLDRVIDMSPFAMWISDKEGTVVRVNRSLCETINLTSDLIVGKYNVLKDVNLEKQGVMPDVKAVFEKHQLARFTIPWKAADAGDVEFLSARDMYIDVAIFPILDAHGDLINVVCQWVDITKRVRVEEALRESKEKLRLALSGSETGMWELDIPSMTGVIDEQAAQILGYPQQDIGSHKVDWDALSHPEDVPLIQKRLADCLAGRTPFFESEHRMRHISGKWVWIVGKGKITHRLQDGSPVRITGTLNAITDRKKAEEALQQANKQLNLLSNITRHDILNQLLVLKGYIDLSREYLGDNKKLLDFVAKEEKAANTIEHQIRFTKDYQDLGIVAPEWQNVNASINKALSKLPMLDVRVEVDPNNPEVFADLLFEKVFYNLIDNALKYGGEDMKKIRFTSQETDTGLKIVYEDNGVGISVEDKKHLFTKGFGKNSGLGLFLSREILAITGITITESGTTGKGARFEITVPKGLYRFTGTGGK